MKERPARPDIEATVRPFDNGVILGRHPDGAMTLRVSGEFVLKVNPAKEQPTTPAEEWAFPTVELNRTQRLIEASRAALSLWESGSGQDAEVCDAMIELRELFDAHDNPEPELVRFNIVKLDHGYYKCFVPERDEDGEDASFFLKLDEETGEGEISGIENL